MKAPHTLKVFDEDLELLRALLSELGGCVESAIFDAVAALVQRDEGRARAVLDSHGKIVALGDLAPMTLAPHHLTQSASLAQLIYPNNTAQRGPRKARSASVIALALFLPIRGIERGENTWRNGPTAIGSRATG